jgi:hypothetical protein
MEAMEQLQLPIRNAAVYSALRHFVSDAFTMLRSDVEAGADVTFSVAEHEHLPGTVPLYEFRPQIERFVMDRAVRIHALKSCEDGAWAIASDPACGAHLRAGRADAVVEMELVAREEIMMPVLLAMSELSPDFELDEDALIAHYLRIERVLYAEQRRYAATTPLWGVRLASGDQQLAPGVRLRQVDAPLFRTEWPEAAQMNWGEQARDGLPAVVLEFERTVDPNDPMAALDPLPAVEQVVAVVRALAGGSIHAGPMVLERLDYRTLAPRPVTTLAARRCGTQPSKLDATIAKTLPKALARLSSDPDGPVARALERYQFAATSSGLGALRSIFDSIVEIYADERDSEAAALRMAVVIGASLPERQQFVDAMRTANRLIREAQPVGDDATEITRLLAAGLRATIAAALVGDLPLSRLQDYADSILLGVRERRRIGVTAMRPALQT